MSSVSLLILTLNEECNLRRCLDSLTWCDDIVVLDSFSTDATESIAGDYHCRFVQRVFDNYAAQRRFGLNDITYKHPWVLMVDADEILTKELYQEIQTTVTNCGDDIVLFRFRRKDHFLGKWIKHSSG